MKISVIGLGKIGACIAAVFSSKGHQVFGVELNPKIVTDFQERRAPFSEPLLQDLILNSDTLTISSDLHYAVNQSDYTIIILPTPSRFDGSFSYDFIIPVLRQIKSIKQSDKTHTVIISSTVSPGTFSQVFLPIFQEPFSDGSTSKVQLVYSPVFVALGSVIRNILNPEVVLIGTNSRGIAEDVRNLFSTVIESQPKYCIISPTSAELAKLAVNTFLTTKISFANMIGELCEFLPDANPDEVLSAVGSDSRIGGKYLRAALGYGGPCFPRDNKALFRTAESLGIPASIAKATDEVNQRQVSRLVEKIRNLTPKASRIGVLGLSYKVDTPVCEASQGIQIANSLISYGYEILVHDPIGIEQARSFLKTEVVVENDLNYIVKEVKLAVISTPWPQYRLLNELKTPEIIILDPWRIL